MAATWVEASVAIVVMGLRTYTNAYILKSFQWDYWWALFTLVCARPGTWMFEAERQELQADK